MIKEHFIFLILVVAAAVITGSTISFVSNINLITPSLNQSNAVYSSSSSINNENINQPNSDDKDTPKNISSVLTDTQSVVINKNEQEQILEMLELLGMTNNLDYNQGIKEFQLQHSLTPSGNLDEQTLSLIIEKAKLQKANNLVNNTVR